MVDVPLDDAPVWLNGVLMPARSARIDPADRGFLLGDGLFETIRVAVGQPCHANRHIARLRAGAELLRLSVPDDGILHGAFAAIIAAHGLADGALRLTVTRGPGPRGVMPQPGRTPTVMVTAAPLPPASGPVRVVIAHGIARDAASPLCRVKSLNYLPGILARTEADERGAADAILLNHAGFVAESSVATVFLYRGGAWLTPRLADGALPGIRRAVLLDAGTVREAEIRPDWLFEAAALCLGNALGLRLVSHVEDREVGRDASALAVLAVPA